MHTGSSTIKRTLTDVVGKAKVFVLMLTMLNVWTFSSFLYCEEEDNDTRLVLEEVKKGDALYGQKRLRENLTHYKKALAIKPSAELYLKIGKVYMNANNPIREMAEEFILQAIALNKEYASAYKILGEIYVEKRQAELAKDAFDKAEALFSRNGNGPEAVLCKRCKRMTDYIMIADKLLYEDELHITTLDSMELWKNLYYYNFASKHTLRLYPLPREQNLFYYMLAAEHTFFKFPYALYKLGVAFTSFGDYNSAAREFKAALSLRPAYKDALYALAASLRETSARHENVEALLREVILISPEWPPAHFQLATELKNRDPSQAAEEFYKAGTLFLENNKASGELQLAEECLHEIKLLSGKSSPIYKKLKHEIHQRRLTSIGQ